jgi:transketolase C-terminal domain/subunit
MDGGFPLALFRLPGSEKIGWTFAEASPIFPLSSVACGCAARVQIPPETLLAAFLFGRTYSKVIEASVALTGRSRSVICGKCGFSDPVQGVSIG